MWDSLEHLLSEQGINLPRKHIKEHLLLTERKQLSTKFDELSRDYKTLALITVADLILNKRESKWRAGLLKSMESKGIILETNDARNSINRILSKVKKYLIGSGISDTNVSSLNTLLNVNLNRIDYDLRVRSNSKELRTLRSRMRLSLVALVCYRMKQRAIILFSLLTPLLLLRRATIMCQ